MLNAFYFQMDSQIHTVNMHLTTLYTPFPCSGDINSIKIGNKTNIQDNVVVHVAKHSLGSGSQPRPTVIGNNVTVGHGATLHACTIGDGCLVSEMGALL